MQWLYFIGYICNFSTYWSPQLDSRSLLISLFDLPQLDSAVTKRQIFLSLHAYITIILKSCTVIQCSAPIWANLLLIIFDGDFVGQICLFLLQCSLVLTYKTTIAKSHLNLISSRHICLFFLNKNVFSTKYTIYTASILIAKTIRCGM